MGHFKIILGRSFTCGTAENLWDGVKRATFEERM